MNFEHFDRLIKDSSFDAVKVLGRDVEVSGHFVHVIGMTLKDGQACVYALESVEAFVEEETMGIAEKTHRQEMKENYENESDIAFLRTREFRAKGKVYEVAGAESSAIGNCDIAESILFFLKMREAGWKMSKKSPLYRENWDCLQLTKVELAEELEELPAWGKDFEIITESYPKTEPLEIPLVLTCGENPEIPFALADGTQATCYINKICLKDVWAEHEQLFSDKEYINRMLEHVSMEELQKMKKQCERALLAECPRGKCYMLVEYECSEDVTLDFYASSYLDAKPQAKEGTATSIFIAHRPEKKVGMHGLKLRGCVIQTAMEAGEMSLEGELFSYTKMV